MHTYRTVRPERLKRQDPRSVMVNDDKPPVRTHVPSGIGYVMSARDEFPLACIRTRMLRLHAYQMKIIRIYDDDRIERKFVYGHVCRQYGYRNADSPEAL